MLAVPRPRPLASASTRGPPRMPGGRLRPTTRPSAATLPCSRDAGVSPTSVVLDLELVVVTLVEPVVIFAIVLFAAVIRVDRTRRRDRDLSARISRAMDGHGPTLDPHDTLRPRRIGCIHRRRAGQPERDRQTTDPQREHETRGDEHRRSLVHP